MPPSPSPSRAQVLAWLKKTPSEEIVSLLLELGVERASEIGIGLYLAGSGGIAQKMDTAFARVRANPKAAAVKAGIGLLRGLFD